MDLKTFVKHPVRPGDPLLADSWNNLVDAMDTVIQRLLAVDTFSLRVTIQNAGIDPATVRVIAVDQATNLPFEAVRAPVAASRGTTLEFVREAFLGTDYVFASMKPGTYQVRAEAPGFVSSSESIEINQAPARLSLSLSPSSVPMPDLFGFKLREALADLKTAGIGVSRVLDVVGKDEPWASPSPEALDAAVLTQHPPAGARVSTGEAARLVIGVVPKPTVMVEVPNLTGLTTVDAGNLLKSKGLILGTTTVARRKKVVNTLPDHVEIVPRQPPIA